MALFSSTQITNPVQENRIFRGRLQFIKIVLFCLFAGIALRVVYLQVINYEEQLQRAKDYHVKINPVTPERGLIYDANGEVLAGNHPIYSLFVDITKTDDREALLQEIGQIINLTDEHISTFHEELKRRRFHDNLIPLRGELTEKEIPRLMVNRHKLGGMEIRPNLRRFYPAGEPFSHILGYTGRISEQDLKEIDEADYYGLDVIGKLGLEKFYEEIMRGQVGYEQVGINAYGRVVESYKVKNPHKGQDLVLWLDNKLQQVIWDLMGDVKGAVVVLDAKSGGIMAMVSKPAYDNNLFVGGISHANFNKLRFDTSSPLLDRATLGRYPPGSTIKPFYAIIALNNKIVTPRDRIYDLGYWQIPGGKQIFRNWKREGHGSVNLRRAIRVSSDTYFYNLAHRMGNVLMVEGLQKFGFGGRTALDSYTEFSDPLPNNKWKIENHGNVWYPGDTINMGIGQGYFTASPIQLATATMTYANKGRYKSPRFLKHINGQDIYAKNEALDAQAGRQEHLAIEASEAHWGLITEAMQEVLTHAEGTAKWAGKGLSYTMAGKTGTSQVISLRIVEAAESRGEKIRDEWKDHGSFLGFVPVEDPRYVFALVLENAGGGLAAALMARKITDYLMLVHNKIGLKDGN